MKFINKINSYRLLVFSIFLFFPIFSPIKAFALTADPAQHFDTTCTGAWSLSSSAGTGWTIVPNSGITIYQIQNAAGDGISDSNDCSPALLSLINCTTNNPTSANSVTITYTDVSPYSAATTFIKLDVNDQFGNRSFQMAVSATNGDYASITSNDVLQNCYTGSPVISGSTVIGWNVLFIQLLGSPNANFSNITATDLIQTVQIIFTSDTNMDLANNPIYIDNLRGDSLLSCNVPTDTATQTATNTATATPTNTTNNTATNTATDTATMVTNTATATASNTATSTATFTTTNTDTNLPTNTATTTATNTTSNTATNTATNTAPNTATNTATVTVSNTATNTAVNTATETATNTPVNSATNTVTNTATVMATSTNTPTTTSTQVNTATATPTSTPTFSPFVLIFPPYPNPSNGTPISFTVQVPGEATVTMDVFTLAFRKISTQTTQDFGTQTLQWDLKDISGIQVANGLYYVRIQVTGINSTTKVLKVLILR